jgi:hypothetical protein
VRIATLLPDGTVTAAGASGALDIIGMCEHPTNTNGAAMSAALIDTCIIESPIFRSGAVPGGLVAGNAFSNAAITVRRILALVLTVRSADAFGCTGHCDSV